MPFVDLAAAVAAGSLALPLPGYPAADCPARWRRASSASRPVRTR